MKVLVTGATGFIGHYVVKSLLKKGVAVVATSSNAEKAARKDWFSDVAYIPFRFEDINDSVNYFEFFQSPDAMIHLAWEGLPNYKDDFHELINLPRHLSLLKNLIGNGLNDLTVTGTCLEYGMQEGALSEDMPVFPANSYARAKNSLRLALEDLQHSASFSLKWVRLFYMYGMGQSPKSLLSQLDRAVANGDMVFNMSGGEQVRDYLPVEVVAENICSIALQKEVEGIINNCSGVPVTVRAFVENYLVTIDKNIQLNLGYFPYPDYEPMKFWGDITKLNKVIKHK